MQRFRARVESRGNGRVVPLPFDAREVFGRVRAPVHATVAGFAFRTTTMRYGGVDYIGLNREVRGAAGVEAGDEVDLTLALDDEPRVVTVPADLAAALGADPAAAAAFEALSYTHRKEYVGWIEEAKREETRRRRVEQALSLLGSGTRTPYAPQRAG